MERFLFVCYFPAVSPKAVWRFNLANHLHFLNLHVGMDLQPSSSLHLIVLTALCSVLFFVGLGRTPFHDRGEPREALAVQDILARGEWLFPMKKGRSIPSKPPLFHWSAALSSRIAGRLDEATVRFPSALYATLGVLTLYALGRQLFGPPVALLGGIILATTLIYQEQATTARVDMTLCFFVTLTLALFYALYRSLVAGRFWYYAFYAILGVAALAKGPLGILLPGLVIGAFLALRKRWEVMRRFCFHEGVLLTIFLSAGWYAIAVSRGGTDFLDLQIAEENVARFFGGSGHSKPVYYYVPYLFLEGLPWSLFLPFLFWDFFRKGSLSEENTLFLKIWVLTLFVFFSLAMGKRSVYLLPLYPALSLLLALWFNNPPAESRGKKIAFRSMAVGGFLFGLIFLAIALTGLWKGDATWFFSLLEPLLRAKDYAKLLVTRDLLKDSTWPILIAVLASSGLWFLLGRNLWRNRIGALPFTLVLISVVSALVARGIVVPAMAEAQSYRSFMRAVNRLVNPEDKLYVFGYSFRAGTDSLVFYRGRPIKRMVEQPYPGNEKIGPGDTYVIMGEEEWANLRALNSPLPPPLLQSAATGPEVDAPLILIRLSGDGQEAESR